MDDEARLIRPAGGTPVLGSLVKIIRCGTAWAIGAYGIVTEAGSGRSVLGGEDGVLVVRVTVHVGTSRESRKVMVRDVVCFASHVAVQQSVARDASDGGGGEKITEDLIDSLMRQGPER